MARNVDNRHRWWSLSHIYTERELGYLEKQLLKGGDRNKQVPSDQSLPSAKTVTKATALGQRHPQELPVG